MGISGDQAEENRGVKTQSGWVFRHCRRFACEAGAVHTISEVRSTVWKVPEGATEQGGSCLPLTSSLPRLLFCLSRNSFFHHCMKTNQYRAASPPRCPGRKEQAGQASKRKGRNAQEVQTINMGVGTGQEMWEGPEAGPPGNTGFSSSGREKGV